MRGTGRPLRFLAVVLAGWTGARALLLWPTADLAAPAQASAPRLATLESPYVAPTPQAAPSLARMPRPPAPVGERRSRSRNAPTIAYPALAPARAQTVAPDALSLAPAVVQRVAPVEPAPALVPPSSPRRWSVSAWLVGRGGSMAGGGPFGPVQLGGSQAGVRLRYGLTRTVALSGRLSTPLRGSGREAGLGIEWQPAKLPVAVLLERRVALDSTRGGTALGAIAGINPTPVAGRWQLEAYGQAGVVVRARREPYADGAARLLLPLGSDSGPRLALGAGVWGGAQRGANRFDVGPSIVATLPTGGPTLRIAADWRQRVAGNAAPGSGPAITLGTDF
ncbi:hypothetical protein ACBY01_07520 [Sphingomonas sp. ac-8]|uniref:hypothetical protein n=1 Tax=Sphingomonas sp. ac-8 TaxID=3242977 RepID=UPI003A7F7E92